MMIKKGRKRRFSISDDAFESDDDGEFMSDHEFEAIFNPSQKKKLGPPEVVDTHSRSQRFELEPS